MKDYVWVVERKVGDVWIPVPHDSTYDRGSARVKALFRRRSGYETRVRKYVRAGK